MCALVPGVIKIAPGELFIRKHDHELCLLVQHFDNWSSGNSRCTLLRPPESTIHQWSHAYQQSNVVQYKSPFKSFSGIPSMSTARTSQTEAYQTVWKRTLNAVSSCVWTLSWLTTTHMQTTANTDTASWNRMDCWCVFANFASCSECHCPHQMPDS